MRSKFHTAVRVALTGIVIATPLFGLVGCGPEIQPMAEQKGTEEAIDKNKKSIEIYKAVNGNYDALKPEQKAELMALNNNEEYRIKAFFIGMKDPEAASRYIREHAPAKTN